jgi:hypothetical protein
MSGNTSIAELMAAKDREIALHRQLAEQAEATVADLRKERDRFARYSGSSRTIVNPESELTARPVLIASLGHGTAPPRLRPHPEVLPGCDR